MTGQPAAPASLAEALAALQAKMPRVAKTNPGQSGQGRYLYADLTDCADALYPLMAPLGLSFTARPTMIGDRFVLAYALRHVCGESDTGEYPLPANASPQGQGAAITYARRYTLCAVTGLAPGGDETDRAEIEHRQHAGEELAQAGARIRRARSAQEKERAKTSRTKAGTARNDRARDTDPWATEPPDEAAVQPEDRPGSIMPGQHRAIEAQLGMLGFKPAERAERHGHAALRLGLDELPPRPDEPDGGPSILGLSADQAARLIRALQDDLDDLKADDARKAASGA